MKVLTFDGLKSFYIKYIKPLKSGAFATVVNNATTTASNTVLDGRMGKTLADKDADLLDAINTTNQRIGVIAERVYTLENKLPCRVRQGTKVVATTGGSTEVVVFTMSQLNALFGVNNATNANSTVILMNGDLAADTKMFATYYRNGDWLYKVDRAYSGGQIRVNYIAVYNG